MHEKNSKKIRDQLTELLIIRIVRYVIEDCLRSIHLEPWLFGYGGFVYGVCLHASSVLHGVLCHGSLDVWGHVPSTFPESLPTKCTIKESDRIQNHSGANLRKGPSLFYNLIVSEPNLLINNTEGKYFINKWLGFGMMIWHPKGLNEQFFYDLEVNTFVESLVKG